MGYRYVEHISDIGIEASGDTLEAAFEAGAEAALNVMFDLESIEEREQVAITAEADGVDLLFVEVINEVLSIQGLKGLAFKKLCNCVITQVKGGVVFSGIARGEAFDPERHGVKTEVKGATYAGLRYEHEEGGPHVLGCVLDV